MRNLGLDYFLLVGKTGQILCIVKVKTNRSIGITIVVTVIWVSKIQPTKAIGTPFVPDGTYMSRLIDQNVYQKVRIAPTVNKRVDKVRL